MIFGVPAESRAGEIRVAVAREKVKKLTAGGHHPVLVQSGGGIGANIPDDPFMVASAKIVSPASGALALSIVNFQHQ